MPAIVVTMPAIFVTIENDKVVAKYDYYFQPGKETVVEIKSRDQLDQLITSTQLDCYFSSSIDFPEESTKNADVIALCNKL